VQWRRYMQLHCLRLNKNNSLKPLLKFLSFFKHLCSSIVVGFSYSCVVWSFLFNASVYIILLLRIIESFSYPKKITPFLRLFKFFSHFREEEFHFNIFKYICSGVERSQIHVVSGFVFWHFKFFLSFPFYIVISYEEEVFPQLLFLFSGTSEGGEGEMPANNCQVTILSHTMPQVFTISYDVVRTQTRQEYNLGSTCSVYFSVWLKWLLLI